MRHGEAVAFNPREERAELPSSTRATPAFSAPPREPPVTSTVVSMPMGSPPAADDCFFDGQAQSTRRCRRCDAYYVDGDDSQCVYHRGTFRAAFIGGPIIWSCCKSGDREVRGCRSASSGHRADSRTDEVLRLQAQLQQPSSVLGFAPVEQAPPADLIDFAADSEMKESDDGPVGQVHKLGPRPNESAPEVPGDGGEVLVRHAILPSDTLPGLALHYGCDVSEILQRNRLPSARDLYSRAFVMVPKRNNRELSQARQEEVERREKLARRRQFQRAVGADDAAAAAYLDFENEDFGAAVRSFQEDVAWERSHPMRRSQMVK